MQLGAAFAGLAIENSMLGAAHSCANPLTARYGIVHGEAVGLMLPHVVRFNAKRAPVAAIYREMYPQGDLAKRLSTLLRAAGMPQQLRHYGITKADLSDLADQAAQQWTAQFNPRPVKAKDFRALYKEAL